VFPTDARPNPSSNSGPRPDRSSRPELKLPPNRVAFRANLVTIHEDHMMIDFAVPASSDMRCEATSPCDTATLGAWPQVPHRQMFALAERGRGPGDPEIRQWRGYSLFSAPGVACSR